MPERAFYVVGHFSFRSSAVWVVGLLRRVQQDPAAGAVRGRPADCGPSRLQEGAAEELRFHRRRHDWDESGVWNLPHDGIYRNLSIIHLSSSPHSSVVISLFIRLHLSIHPAVFPHSFGGISSFIWKYLFIHLIVSLTIYLTVFLFNQLWR